MYTAIIGGKLQGIEAAYLARKADWHTLLIDARPSVPAAGLCDRTVQADVRNMEAIQSHLRDVDLIIPALENQEALIALKLLADRCGIPLAFDPVAYAVSASKSKSNLLFESMGLCIPPGFPGSEFPILVKPDVQSGSQGVEIIVDAAMFEKRFKGGTLPDGWIAQSFVDGPSYSLEVIGMPGRYITPQVTDLRMDAIFDCKGVLAPTDLPAQLCHEFEELAVRIAETIELTGIMDVEVILNNGQLKILEIDARLPSQTPTAVYWSTGLNMLSLLKAVFVDHHITPTTASSRPRPVWYEHIQVCGDTLMVCGEHIMAKARTIHFRPGFFGAAEALTDFRPGCDKWVASLIHTASDPQDLMQKRAATLKDIQRHFGLTRRMDSSPPAVVATGVQAA